MMSDCSAFIQFDEATAVVTVSKQSYQSRGFFRHYSAFIQFDETTAVVTVSKQSYKPRASPLIKPECFMVNCITIIA
jgi:hypothetical protein